MTSSKQIAALLTEAQVHIQEATDFLADSTRVTTTGSGTPTPVMTDSQHQHVAYIGELYEALEGWPGRRLGQPLADNVRRLREEAAEAARRAEDRDQERQADIAVLGKRVEKAERERDTARALLRGVKDALDVVTFDSDLPRRVRELRNRADAAEKVINELRDHMGLEDDADTDDVEIAVKARTIHFDNAITDAEQGRDAANNQALEAERRCHAVVHENEDLRTRVAFLESMVPAEPASREPDAEFAIGDMVWTAKYGTGTVHDPMCNEGSQVPISFPQGLYVDVHKSDVRHVFDADHEPPSGVDVVRDMGTTDPESAYLCRTRKGNWEWQSEPDHQRLQAHGRWWRPTVDEDDITGPLVEWKPGDPQ